MNAQIQLDQTAAAALAATAPAPIDEHGYGYAGSPTPTAESLRMVARRIIVAACAAPAGVQVYVRRATGAVYVRGAGSRTAARRWLAHAGEVLGVYDGRIALDDLVDDLRFGVNARSAKP